MHFLSILSLVLWSFVGTIQFTLFIVNIKWFLFNSKIVSLQFIGNSKSIKMSYRVIFTLINSKRESECKLTIFLNISNFVKSSSFQKEVSMICLYVDLIV